MKYDFTGVILAGGHNSRLPGIKKAFHTIGGKMIMDMIHQRLSALFSEVIIVTNDPCAFAGWGSMVVTDINPSKCSLAGIHAGLFYASNPNIFVSACDIPFLKTAVMEKIVSHMEPGYDVVIPETDDGLEPLCAAYSKNCLPLIQNSLDRHVFMVKKFFKKNRTQTIPVRDIKQIDPKMHSFFNVNTPQDLVKANEIRLDGFGS
ncbi:MAG TPA: molybdenum cofactor guanylyltransferase [Desulfobacteraceae bacterium]|nr:molybdenum cofactor guanylyltransferase [Desulfobacteraceae bacterium]